MMIFMANQNNTLKLVLTHKWYDMIESGVKTEEYREVTRYWGSRLIDNFEYRWKQLTGFYYSEDLNRRFHLELKMGIRENIRGFKPYTHVQFQRAYPKNPPRMTKAIKSIRIGTGKPELGAEPNKLYFVIELG